MTIQKLIDRGVSISSIFALTFQLDRSEASDCKLVRRISITTAQFNYLRTKYGDAGAESFLPHVQNDKGALILLTMILEASGYFTDGGFG